VPVVLAHFSGGSNRGRPAHGIAPQKHRNPAARRIIAWASRGERATATGTAPAVAMARAATASRAGIPHAT